MSGADGTPLQLGTAQSCCRRRHRYLRERPGPDGPPPPFSSGSSFSLRARRRQRTSPPPARALPPRPRPAREENRKYYYRLRYSSSVSAGRSECAGRPRGWRGHAMIETRLDIAASEAVGRHHPDVRDSRYSLPSSSRRSRSSPTPSPGSSGESHSPSPVPRTTTITSRPAVIPYFSSLSLPAPEVPPPSAIVSMADGGTRGKKVDRPSVYRAGAAILFGAFRCRTAPSIPRPCARS